MVERRNRSHLLVATVVFIATITFICAIVLRVDAQTENVGALRRIIAFFDDSRLDKSEAAGYNALLARLPADERQRLENALARLVRGELLLEKARTANTGIPFLIVAPKEGGPHPAVLFMHGAGGGGLLGKETAIPYFALMADRGYLLVAFDARDFGERGGIAQVALTGETGIYPKIVIPTACQDVFEVAEYIRSRHDVLKDHIGMFGYSMGALITLGAAAHDTDKVLKAVVAAAGGADFHRVLSARKSRGEPVADLPAEVVAQIEKFDPVNHLESFYPTAVLMINGRKDTAAPVEGAQSFVNALQSHYKSTPERLELRLMDTGHELYPTWIEEAFDWFDKFLRLECASDVG